MPVQTVPENTVNQPQTPVTLFPFETGQGWTNPKTPKQRWKFLEASYYGSGGYSEGRYLFPHRREDLTCFNNRKIKARFTNDQRAIINGHITPIFRGSASRNFGDSANEQEVENLQLFLEDCDGAGTSYETFMKKAARSARIYDSTFVLIDNEPTENVLSKADLKERENMPYLFLITPDRIKEIKMNELGEVTYIKWLTYEDTTEETPANINPVVTNLSTTVGESLNLNVVIEWTPERILRTVEGRQTVEKVNELGIVPVFPLYPEGNDDPVLQPLPFGMAWTLASLQYRVYNQDSMIDEIADSQAFSILVIPGPRGNFTLGTGNSLTGVPVEGNQPSYISPDAEQMTVLIELKRTIVEDMYRTGVMPHLRTFAESSESKLLNNERTYEVLVDFRDQIKALDEKLINTFLDYQDSESIEYSADYPQNFGIHNLEQDMELFTMFDESVQGAPPDLLADIVKRINRVSFKGKDEEDMKEDEDMITAYYLERAELIANREFTDDKKEGGEENPPTNGNDDE